MVADGQPSNVPTIASSLMVMRYFCTFPHKTLRLAAAGETEVLASLTEIKGPDNPTCEDYRFVKHLKVPRSK